MFIKVFVPNSRGKIELTVEELEELLSDACEKAVKEKCATCNRGWYGTGITYLNSGNNGGSNTDWTKVTCSNENARVVNLSTQSTLSNTVNELIGE
jgi:hypothetical protein